jgi:hypothetical protein
MPIQKGPANLGTGVIETAELATTLTVTHALGSASTPSITFTGDTNTGIFSPTADTIAFAEGGVEAARFDPSGQFVIGTTTSDALLHVYKTSGKVATFGNNVNNNGNYIVLGGTLSNKNWVLANNMIVGGEFGVGRTSANGGTTIGSAYDLMIDTNGGVKVANTLGVGYTTPSTSGAGITFPATQSASSDANTLDDYEEGTFTPAFQAQTGTLGSITYENRSGKYTKIGNVVYFALQFYTSAFAAGSGSGDLYVGGLPFTVGNATQCQAYVGDIRLWNSNNPSASYIQGSNTYVALLYRTTSNGEISWTQVSHARTTNPGNVTTVSGFYYI